MARPKKKSALVDGMTELVQTLRNIESKLALLIKEQKSGTGKRGRGRPPGKSGKRGRPPGKKGRRGRPPGSKNKAK
jgi:hypothetical protein